MTYSSLTRVPVSERSARDRDGDRWQRHPDLDDVWGAYSPEGDWLGWWRPAVLSEADQFGPFRTEG